jgi:hypothetical protein
MTYTFNDIVSTISGIFILLFCFLVMKLYWTLATNLPRGRELGDPGSWFAHGIVVGFFAVGLNAFFWKFAFRLSKLTGKEDFVYWVANYGGFFDFGIFLLTMWAGFCHLYSAYLNLPENHRHNWMWFTVPWYPSPNSFTRFIQKMMRRNLERKE